MAVENGVTSRSLTTVEMTDLRHCSKEDIRLMTDEYKKLCSPSELAERAIQMLLDQKGMYGGCKIDLLEHGLQTATRAYKDSADEETIVCCLLHDIGEVLSPTNHGDIPAGILKPYISEKNWWILAHHEVFQGYYYFQHVGLDVNTRDVYRSSPYYDATVYFCENYDAPSFDPEYTSLSIETFRPMVHQIFSRTPFFHNPGHPKAGTVLGKNTCKA